MNAQDITNLLTAGLAIATVWLGLETRRMAVAAKASIDLESRPYLSFRGFLIKTGIFQDFSPQSKGAFRIGLRLFNPGKVLISYSVKNMDVSVNDIVATNPHFETTGGVIHPTEELIFFYPIITSLTPIKAPAVAEVKFSINYWATPNEIKNLNSSVRVLITSDNDHEWTYTDGPNYQ